MYAQWLLCCCVLIDSCLNKLSDTVNAMTQMLPNACTYFAQLPLIPSAVDNSYYGMGEGGQSIDG